MKIYPRIIATATGQWPAQTFSGTTLQITVSSVSEVEAPIAIGQYVSGQHIPLQSIVTAYNTVSNIVTITFPAQKVRGSLSTGLKVDFYEQNIRSEFYRDKFFACDLVEFHLYNTSNAYSPLWYTTNNFDMNVITDTSDGEQTFSGQGDFLGVSAIGEEMDIKVNKFTITLSAINNTLIDTFTTWPVEGQRVVIYKSFLELNSLQVVDYPIMTFDGVIMGVNVKETNTTCDISIDCSTQFVDFERTTGRKTNNISNWYYQGNERDKCFDKSGWVGQTQLGWGRKV